MNNKDEIDHAAFKLLADLAKDIIDSTKSRTLFFAPFLGLFIGSLIARPEIVQNLGYPAKILISITFIMSLFYVYTLMSLLDLTETIKLSSNLAYNSNGDFAREIRDNNIGIAPDSAQFTRAVFFERKIFKITMNLLYFSCSLAIFDIYFKQSIDGHVLKIIQYFM